MIIRDLTLVWLKGGVPLETWKQGKEFFLMNAIKISPVMIRKYAKQGDINFIIDKVKSYISSFYKNEPLQENYMIDIIG